MTRWAIRNWAHTSAKELRRAMARATRSTGLIMGTVCQRAPSTALGKRGLGSVPARPRSRRPQCAGGAGQGMLRPDQRQPQRAGATVGVLADRLELTEGSRDAQRVSGYRHPLHLAQRTLNALRGQIRVGAAEVKEEPWCLVAPRKRAVGATT